MTTAVATPTVASTRAELAEGLASTGSGHGDVVLVPTMGALHDGHASLVRAARERAGTDGTVVVSIFVNPTQFGEGEDLDRYPRTFDADLEVCGREGADLVFAPSVDEVYPGGVSTSSTNGGVSTSSTNGGVSTSSTNGGVSLRQAQDTATGSTNDGGGAVTVDPGPLADRLEGASRPGHFRGVLTVVAKLFGLVRPDVAVFGEKDYQQLVLIRRMVTDLCLSGRNGPIEIVGAPTDREDDGLARSSRNRYLDDEQRHHASALSRILYVARDDAAHGLDAALNAARAELRTAAGVDLDYLTILDANLHELPAEVPPGTEARALIAARVGSTRLIDNVALTLGVPATGGDH